MARNFKTGINIEGGNLSLNDNQIDLGLSSNALIQTNLSSNDVILTNNLGDIIFETPSGEIYFASTLALDNTEDNILVIDSLTGRIKYREALSISSGGGTNETFLVSGSRTQGGGVTNTYLQQDGSFMNTVPFVLPYDVELYAMSASGSTPQSWFAEVHDPSSIVSGATLTVSASTSAYIEFVTPIMFSAGDRISLFVNGSSIEDPRIGTFFRRI